MIPELTEANPANDHELRIVPAAIEMALRQERLPPMDAMCFYCGMMLPREGSMAHVPRTQWTTARRADVALQNPADAKIKVSRYHRSGTKSIYSDKKDDDGKKPYDGVIGNGQAAAALGKQLNQSKGIRNLELQHQNPEPKAMESLAKPMAGLESLEELVRPPPGCFCLRLHGC